LLDKKCFNRQLLAVGYNHEWNGCVAFKEKQVILATQMNADELKKMNADGFICVKVVS